MIKCPQCSKTFSHRENLIRHSRNHKAVKPHICPVCNKGFSRSDLLAKHEKLHNKTSFSPSTRKQTTDLSTFEPSKRRKTTNDEFEDVTVAQETGSFSPGIPETETQILNSSGIVDVGENTLQASTRLPALSQSTIGCDTEEPRLPYFDFLSFSQPWNPEILTGSSEWFSGDFYEALDETNGRGFNTFDSYQPAFFPFGMNVLPMSFDDLGSRTGPSASTMTYLESRPLIAGISLGTSCPPLSPAQTSCEDRLPSREPPSHRQSHPPPESMTLEKNDPLILDHDSTFDISDSVHKEVADLLNMNERKNSAGYSPMPSLKIVNIFIGLFFRDFYPQSPVLHLPTTCTNNLPRPLIAIIIIIGAIHSKLKGSQRFATNALDCLRQKLHLIVENNNTLLGDLNIIYTSVLVCYTGLWCGNKRAFDIADNMRSAAVTYIRRLPRHQGLRNPSNKIHFKSQWSEWIGHESQKRLQWFVYMVDNQFPSLHNMPAIIPIAEVMKWELPCDEEFWAATTAGRWKSILGSAPQPPGPLFAVAVAPFMWPREGDRGWSSHGIRLNPWSAYLVLTALSLKTFEHSQHLSTLNQISLYDSEEYNESDSDRPGPQPSPIMQPDFIVCLRRAILKGLKLWEQTFSTSPTSQDPFHQVNTFFNTSSHFLLHLCLLYLNIPLMDLQEAIGKNGPENASKAFSRLKMWFVMKPSHLQPESNEVDDNSAWTSDTFAMNGSSEAIKLIELGLKTQSKHSSVPLSIISLFLSHVALWAIAKTAPLEVKALIPALVNPNTLDEASWTRLRKVLDLVISGSERGNMSDAGLILKQCANTLTKLGYWGASLNLAFLLQQLTGGS